MDEPLGRQLSLTSKAVRAWTDAVLHEHGSSLSTWIVLWRLEEADRPGFSQRELARQLGIGGPALVRHLDRLEAEGLVRRTRDAADRRVTRVTLTPEGRRLLRRLAVVIDRHDAELRQQLTAHELEVLRRALTKVGRHARSRLHPETDDETGAA